MYNYGVISNAPIFLSEIGDGTCETRNLVFSGDTNDRQIESQPKAVQGNVLSCVPLKFHCEFSVSIVRTSKPSNKRLNAGVGHLSVTKVCV